MTLNDLFGEFIMTKKLAGLSDKTLRDYTDFINPFIKHIGCEVSIDNLSQISINQYITLLLNRKISRSTLSTYIRNMKIFVKWISENYTVSYDYSKIKVPKSPKKKVRVYSDSEIRTIFNEVTTAVEWLTIRNKSIISLMLDSGLRQSEVCDLLHKHVMYDSKRVIVHGKGDKERIVPLGSYTIELLKQYSNLCPFKGEYVFISRTGDNMTADSIKHLVTKLSNKLPFDLSSHKLRHNFATNYCLDMYARYGQIDIYKLMYIMGHEDVETTRRYLHMANEIMACSGCISHVDNVFNSV